MALREGISGRHAVLQALRSGRQVHSVLADEKLVDSGEMAAIKAECARRNLPIRWVTAAEIQRTCQSASQGVGALVAAMPDFSVKDLIDLARAGNEEPLLVAVDGVEDPQNLGAIARSAMLAGAHGMIVPDKGTATIGVGAMKAASGAFSTLPVARVANLVTAIATLQREHVWVVGADANGGKAPWKMDLKGGFCLVLGSESDGLGKQTLAALDAKTCIPTPGGDISLNVSAAAAVLLFEAVRQRKA